MEAFFKKYGVKTEHAFFSHVANDPVFAMRVASDYFEEKFPREVVKETVVAPAQPVEGHVVMHPDFIEQGPADPPASE